MSGQDDKPAPVRLTCLELVEELAQLHQALASIAGEVDHDYRPREWNQLQNTGRRQAWARWLRESQARVARLAKAEIVVDPKPEIAPELYKAIAHTLDQIQENPDVRYYAGPGCQIFYLLIRAEAVYLGHPLEEVEARRKVDTQPHYRKREAEIIRVREERDELRRELGR